MAVGEIVSEEWPSVAVDGRPIILLQWCDPWIWVEPAPEVLLRALPFAGSAYFKIHDIAGIARTEPGKLYIRADGHRETGLNTFAALDPVVFGVLTGAGYTVKEFGDRVRPLDPPQPVCLNPTWVVDHVLLDLIQHQVRGLIRYPRTLVNVVRLIAQVATAWPDKTLALVASESDQAWRFTKALRGLLPHVCIVTGEHKPAQLNASW